MYPRSIPPAAHRPVSVSAGTRFVSLERIFFFALVSVHRSGRRCGRTGDIRSVLVPVDVNILGT